MKRIALVTGANQGLGFALVAGLSRSLGPGGEVYLTARSRAAGEAAVDELRREGLAPVFHPLDVTVPESVDALASTLQERHGGVDIVISNAAARISKDVDPGLQVRMFVETNNLGTTRVLRAFGPLLRDGGRFVVVASSFGTLRRLPEALHARFEAESLDEIDGVMRDYVAAVEAGTTAADGWPDWINIASKVGQVAAMRIFARQARASGLRDVVVNAACPGLVDTAASRPWFADMSSAQTPAEAAVDVVWLATLPAGSHEPFGCLVRHREILPWK